MQTSYNKVIWNDLFPWSYQHSSKHRPGKQHSSSKIRQVFYFYISLFTIYLLFCNFIKGITLKICMLRFVLINIVAFNHSCIWIRLPWCCSIFLSFTLEWMGVCERSYVSFWEGKVLSLRVSYWAAVSPQYMNAKTIIGICFYTTWIRLTRAKHTHPCTLTHTPAHTHMHVCTHTHTHTCMYTHAHTCMYTHMHVHTHTCTHVHTHTCTHTNTHTCTHTHTHDKCPN